MGRLLVFVFVVVLLGSCSRKSKVHYELEVLHNTNLIELELIYNSLDHNSYIIRGNGAGDLSSSYETPVPFPVGNSYHFMARNDRKLFPMNSNYSRYKLKKGTHVTIYLSSVCDSTVVNSTPDSIQCDFAISIEVFVDNTLHEEFYLWNFEREMIDFTVP